MLSLIKFYTKNFAILIVNSIIPNFMYNYLRNIFNKINNWFKSI